MVSIPGNRLINLPESKSVATEVFECPQKPPDVVSVSELIVSPGQILSRPVIVPALGKALMVIGKMVISVPQEFVTVYFTVSFPANNPVIRFESLFAWRGIG